MQELSVAANITLASLGGLTRHGLLDIRRERSIAADYMQRFAIKTPSLDARVGTLSGGNQQKVALARWLALSPRVLILDEPTQGVDIGAKAEIHRADRRPRDARPRDPADFIGACRKSSA